MSPRSRPTTVLFAMAAFAASALVAGCSVPAPKGDAPLRYRDQVFTSVTETPDQQYGESVNDQDQAQKLWMDLYQPAGDTKAKRPALIWIHGGGFTTGTRKDGMMTELSRRFARRGYVVGSISYRLMSGPTCGGEASVDFCSPAALAAADDARAAVRYLRKNAAALRIDTDRIAIGGASAGAIASILVGAGQNSTGTSGNPGYSNAVRAVVSISGGLPFDGVFGDGDAPTLFWHGTADTVVPFAWAQSNVEYMQDVGAIAFPRFVNGAGHVPTGTYFDDMDEQSRNWLYAMLSLASLNATTPPASTPAVAQ